MEWKTLMLGIGMSMGVFGVKAGAGLYGAFQTSTDNGDGWKSGLSVAVGYALVFALLAAGLWGGRMLYHVDALLRWLQAGMLVHVLMALLLSIWGLGLKRSKISGTYRRNGWWLLVLPCPVCMTVIGISMGFLMALFPGAVLKSVALLYGGFMAVVFGTAYGLSRWAERLGGFPHDLLADAMLILSAYFLLSILIMPQFSGIEEISRMGRRTLQTPTGLDLLQSFGTGATGIVLFGIGYMKTGRRGFSVFQNNRIFHNTTQR